MRRLRHWPQTAARLIARPAIVIAALGLQACDLNVTVTGVVRDPSGRPLQGVAVTLETPGREPDRATTIADGTFNVGIVGAEPRQTRISFHKDGFQEVARELGEDARPTMEVTLSPN
jgi:hypothetical protein